MVCGNLVQFTVSLFGGLADCPLGATKKALAFIFAMARYMLNLLPSSSSFSFPFLPPTSSWNAAGGEPRAGPGAASGGARGAGRPPLARPEAGPGSLARPNLRRATGGRGWEKRESERRCSVSGGWADAGREGRGGGDPLPCSQPTTTNQWVDQGTASKAEEDRPRQ